MKPRESGKYVNSTAAGQAVRAFVPHPLPPKDLPLTAETRREMDSALLALGRLDSAAAFIPDRNILLYLYIRKEAVLSSQIEGTQSTLEDLLMFEVKEVPGVPIDDVTEVSTYVRALEHGLARIREGFPLSNRLIREMHKVLLTQGRGETKDPGEFRRVQNWVGGKNPKQAHLIPPPPNAIDPCMGDLELFLHDEHGSCGILEKAALSHVQFETIHPFLDGNGRIGRLLITLLLCSEKVIREPLLYVSLYFKTHRKEYYERLDAVRTHSDWDGWIRFFSIAVRTAADQASTTAHKLDELAKSDRASIRALGRKAGSIMRVFDALRTRPIIHVQEICAFTGLVPNTVGSCLATLTDMGLVKEVSGKSRNRLFAYYKVIQVMDEGTNAG